MSDGRTEYSEVVYEIPSLLKRSIVYLVTLLVVVAAAILYFGKVYVVVTGRGRIAPEGDVVLVQALQGGVVNAVLAKTGDRLPAGAPVLKVDVSETGVTLAELQQKQAVQREQLEKLRATKAEGDRILANPGAALHETPNRSIATVGNVMQLVNDLENAQAKIDAAQAAIAAWPSRRGGMQREVELTRENVRVNENSYVSQGRLLESTEAALVQKRSQLDSFRGLAERRLISSLELGVEEEKVRAAEASATEARRKYEQLAVDISNQRIKLQELEGRLSAEPAVREGASRQAQNALRQMLGLLRQEGQNLAIQIQEVAAALKTTEMKLKMAANQVSLTSVTMPVAGMIAEMKVANTGELLTSGALVATVVPDGVPLVVEAALPNRDIGFVKPGIEGRVKVDAYPFQQFGTLPARVRSVLPGLGSQNNFTIELELLATRIVTRDGELPLFPGLAVEVELLTSRQRLLNLLLEPSAVAGRKE